MDFDRFWEKSEIQANINFERVEEDVCTLFQQQLAHIISQSNAYMKGVASKLRKM